MRDIFVEQGGATSFIDLFKKSQDQIAQARFATLAQVKAIVAEYSDEAGYGMIEYWPIPCVDLKDPQYYEGYIFSDEFEVGDLILIVYTDRDFRTALKATSNMTMTTTKSTDTHSEMYGIAVKLKGGAQQNEQ